MEKSKNKLNPLTPNTNELKLLMGTDNHEILQFNISHPHPPIIHKPASNPRNGSIKSPKIIISCVIITKDKKSQFISTYSTIQHHSLADLKLIKCHKQASSGTIQQILATNDSQYLFSSDDMTGLKQWSIPNKILFKDFGEIIGKNAKPCQTMTLTDNDQFQFQNNYYGTIKLFDIKKQKIVKDMFRLDDKAPVYNFVVTKDQKFLQFNVAYESPEKQEIDYRKRYEGILKKFCLSNKKVVKKIGGFDSLSSIIKTNNEKFVFVGDDFGMLHQICQKKWVLVKTIRMGNDQIEMNQSVMVISDDDRLLFTSYAGYLQQWCVKRQMLIKNFGYVRNCKNDALPYSMAIC